MAATAAFQQPGSPPAPASGAVERSSDPVRLVTACTPLGTAVTVLAPTRNLRLLEFVPIFDELGASECTWMHMALLAPRCGPRLWAPSLSRSCRLAPPRRARVAACAPPADPARPGLILRVAAQHAPAFFHAFLWDPRLNLGPWQTFAGGEDHEPRLPTLRHGTGALGLRR